MPDFDALAAKLEKTLHSIAERDMDSAQLERFLSAQVSKPSSVNFGKFYFSLFVSCMLMAPIGIK